MALHRFEISDDQAFEIGDRVYELFVRDCYPAGAPLSCGAEFARIFRDWFIANEDQADVKHAFWQDMITSAIDESIQEQLETGRIATFQEVGPGGKLKKCIRSLDR